MDLNSAIYVDSIVTHSIDEQWKAQFEAMSFIQYHIVPEQINEAGSLLYDFNETITAGFRRIILENDVFKSNHEFYDARVVYNKEYSLSDFMTAIGSMVLLFHNGSKVLATNTFITIHSPTKCVIRMQDSDTSLTGYSLLIKKLKTPFTIWNKQTTPIILSYATDVIKSKIYFIDGNLAHITFVFSNGIGTATLDGTNHVIEEYTVANVMYNGSAVPITINGLPCLSIPNSTGYINPDCVLYMEDVVGSPILVPPLYVSYRHLQVPSTKNYYVILFHDNDNIKPVDDLLSKFENTLGTIEANQALIL